MNAIPDPAPWTPKVLSEYEVGRATAAIEAIALTGKPIAEVGCRRAAVADLEADLRGCLELSAADRDVQVWTRPATGGGGRFRFGFYTQPWVLAAIDFLDRADLADVHRSWISGLLFGYRADAIQQFISRNDRFATALPGEAFGSGVPEQPPHN